MECPSCGSGNPEGNRFCGGCGTPLPQRCLACGHESPAGQRFCGGCGVALTGASRSERPSAAPASPTAPSAERRQLTVMFCDLVGSTALSARLDPEDLREIIGAYHRCCAGVIERASGFVARYMGDGVLAYFGYPIAHEDDAEQAAQAGLDLVDAVRQLDTAIGVALQVRIGIATGVVIVGDLIGEGIAQEQDVVGDTPNIAARLQALAAPGTVVIAEGTRRLLGGLFDCRDLGLVDLKGFDVPMRAWRVLRRSAVVSHFEARQEAGLTPLVGRDEELELLERRWRRARAGEGRVVVLSGEPGIGKSRLTAAIQETICAEPHIRLRFFCSPHHQNSAFHPFIAQLERAAAFTRDDTPEDKLGKLEALLGSTTPPPDDVALLAGLLSIPVEGRYRPPNMSPQRKKTRTFEALQRQLEALARQRPVLMIFEDMHWCDPTSRELLDLVVERAVRLPVLLIITSRPEFQPPWSGQAHVMILTLNRLDPHYGSALVERIAGSQVLPSAVIDEIVERTDGVPLFVEELTKAVVEAGPRGDDSARVISTMPLPPLAVPPTLYASLLARLDRLGAAAKEIAQFGAAIGREFGYEFLAAVTGRADSELQFILDQLASAGLIFRRGTPPQASFLFKHALVRDAAYGSLLRDRRRRLHADIAATLERQFPEIAAAQPELLAQHWMEASLPAKAIAYWFKAGEQALARSTMTEAAAQLRKGLALVPGLPDGVERRRHELDLQIALGRALSATQGYSASAAGDTYARARQLCEELNQPPQTTSVLYGQWLYHLNRAQLAQARQLAAEIRRSGDIHDDLAVRQAGCRLSGITCLFLGEFTTARSDLEESLRLYDPGLRHLYAALAVSDPRVATLVHSSQVLFYLGHLDQARVRRDQALGEARERAHPFTLAVALSQTLCGEWGIQPAEASLPHAEELVALSTEQDFPLYRALGAMFHGWCLAALGQGTEGIALLTSGLAAHRATGSTLYVPFGLTLLAEAYGRVQQSEEALKRLDEAARLVEETQERWVEAELHRLRGELLASIHQNVAAEASLQKALAVARRQAAKTAELHAATCLGRLWRNQGRHAEARALLEPIYGWFTEGGDTPNLCAARVLLDELGEPVV